MNERNKIVQSLNALELEEFVAVCVQTPRLTLRAIVKLAAERGVRISVTSAKAFRDTTYERLRDRILDRVDRARRLAALCGPGEERSPLRAAEVLLAEAMFHHLSEERNRQFLELQTAGKVLRKLRAASNASRRLGKLQRRK